MRRHVGFSLGLGLPGGHVEGVCRPNGEMWVTLCNPSEPTAGVSSSALGRVL